MTNDLPTRLLAEIERTERFTSPDYNRFMVRLCQAHREIVELHMVCMADHAQIKDRLANSEMRPVVRAEWEQKATEALVRLQMSEHYLGVLARAYNLEESP